MKLNRRSYFFFLLKSPVHFNLIYVAICCNEIIYMQSMLDNWAFVSLFFRTG